MTSEGSAFGIYAHAPWCRIHCPYCSFVVAVDPDPPFRRWLDRCLQDFDRLAQHYPGVAETVFVGGGTPSLIPTPLLAELFSGLPVRHDAERTIEVNPGRLAPAYLDAYLRAGVNRLSLGVQSFSPRIARRLGRGHTVTQARQLAGLVGSAGFRSWSVDLIFAVPSQTLEELDADLDEIERLGPPHVSLYGLEFHPGTPFTRARDQGRMVPTDEDTWRAQYDRVVSRLNAGGWERYEVSNFARPGHRARHNEAVWRGGHYAGIGPGAHGLRPDGMRTRQADTLAEWLDDGPGSSERPDLRQAAVDFVLSTMRHVDGLPLEPLRRRFGLVLDADRLAGLTKAGLLSWSDGHLRLEPAGFPVADGLVERVVDAMEVDS
jgi:oxygen-independent coproporphyrinogen III oxidase